ncbi:MAG: amino acid transporter [Marivivens sp.]|nr:amino acid transporter [Marivivens sp.]
MGRIFVLRQGLRREHVLAVVATCALSDAVLIAAGVAGIGAAVDALPWLMPLLRWGGVAFLGWYGARSFLSAWRGGAVMTAGDGDRVPLAKVMLTCLAFTWLNPHVYLDTVVLIGSLSAQFEGREWVFGAGAMSGSVLFFTTLGYGGSARSGRVVDACHGLLLCRGERDRALSGRGPPRGAKRIHPFRVELCIPRPNARALPSGRNRCAGMAALWSARGASYGRDYPMVLCHGTYPDGRSYGDWLSEPDCGDGRCSASLRRRICATSYDRDWCGVDRGVNRNPPWYA